MEVPVLFLFDMAPIWDAYPLNECRPTIFEEEIKQGRLAGGVDAQPFEKFVYDRPVPLLHLLEGRLQ